MQYLGLNSLFTSILMVLSLSELGVGSALVYSMYKPMAENDEERICALLKVYKKFYRVIGVIISVVGLILLPFLRFLISGTYPKDINIYILYLIYLVNTALSYFCLHIKVIMGSISKERNRKQISGCYKCGNVYCSDSCINIYSKLLCIHYIFTIEYTNSEFNKKRYG